MRRLVIVAVLAVLAAATPTARQNAGTPLEIGTTAFESYIESLRQQAGIPSISAALVQDGVVVWERGLGLADVEARIGATATTPYLIGDLSQPFAAVLLLQCVEQRRLYLDDPLRDYGLPGSSLTLRRLLSHSADGVFRY